MGNSCFISSFSALLNCVSLHSSGLTPTAAGWVVVHRHPRSVHSAAVPPHPPSAPLRAQSANLHSVPCPPCWTQAPATESRPINPTHLKDGVLDRASLLTFIFARCDDDDDGKLSLAELRQLSIKSMKKQTASDLALQKEVFDKMDKDGDGNVSMSEFIAYHKETPKYAEMSDEEFNNQAQLWLEVRAAPSPRCPDPSLLDACSARQARQPHLDGWAEMWADGWVDMWLDACADVCAPSPSRSCRAVQLASARVVKSK